MLTNRSLRRLVQLVAYRVASHFLPVILLLSIISGASYGFVDYSCWSAKSVSRGQRGEHGVRLVTNEKERRIDVIIDGEPFTSYIWPETLMKPVLYPVRTARGTVVTRSFPLELRAGESKIGRASCRERV